MTQFTLKNTLSLHNFIILKKIKKIIKFIIKKKKVLPLTRLFNLIT